MVDDALLEREKLGFEEWAQTPSKDDITPDSVKYEMAREEFIAQIDTVHESAVVVSHNDADGLGSAALIRVMEGGSTAVAPVSYHGPYSLTDALEDVRDFVDFSTTLYITDLGCDDVSVVDILEDIEHPIVWYDHHQWDDEMLEAVREAGVNLVVDEEECGTSLIEKEADYDFPDYIQELAEVTKDIDLWIKDDPRSERLGIMSRALDDEVYINSVRVCGVKHPKPVEKQIDEYLEHLQELEEFAYENYTLHDINGYTVVLSYVRGGRTSTIGNYFAEDHDPQYDIAIVLTPDAGHVYSNSNGETFDRCHKIARKMNGGGHPTASGFQIPVSTFREMAGYWMTKGASIEDKVIAAVDEVTESG